MRLMAQILALLMSISLAMADDAFVAGLRPDQRPAGAPRITTAEVDANLVARRLQGLATPWPGNLETIAAQGNWYSPLFRPGMGGPYDLRGLHAP